MSSSSRNVSYFSLTPLITRGSDRSLLLSVLFFPGPYWTRPFLLNVLASFIPSSLNGAAPCSEVQFLCTLICKVYKLREWRFLIHDHQNGSWERSWIHQTGYPTCKRWPPWGRGCCSSFSARLCHLSPGSVFITNSPSESPQNKC